MNTLSQDLIEKLTILVENNIQNTSFTISHVYTELGISRTQLHRVIKKETGLSTTLFIRKIRLQKAVSLLQDTELRISEIASLTGIDSPQNFSKYFVQEYSLSPSEFRKQAIHAKQLLPDVNLNVEKELKEEVLPLKEISRRPKKLPLSLIGTLIALGVVVGVLLSGKATLFFSDTVADATTMADFNNSLAILPFKTQNISETVNDGIMEHLHDAFSQIEQLKVIARTSSNQYTTSQTNFSQIGNELNVEYLLLGSLLQANKKVQISLQLLKTKGEATVWKKMYEVDEKYLYRITNTIIRDVAIELKQDIPPKLSQRLNRRFTTNQRAYNEFLQGRALMITREKQKINQSIIKFERAIAIDSNFAEAYAYKAIAYNLNGNLGYENLATSNNIAEQNALMAIKLDAQNATAYAILGNVYREQYKWEQARTAYQISMQYKPNDAQTVYWYSLLLRSIGKPKEAVEYSRKAIALDPLYPVILAGHIINCAYAGRDDLAQVSINNGRLLFSKSFVFYNGLAYYELINGNYSQALVQFNKAEELNPDMQFLSTLTMYCEAKTGQTRKALDYINSLGDTPTNNLSKAMVYSGLGEENLSMSFLEKAADAGKIHYDLLLHPTFRSFHQNPRFLAVLEKFELNLF